MMKNGSQISRRGFAKILGTSAAFAALRPSLSMSAPALRLVSGASPAAAVVRLSSNENPYGPSPLATKAMTDAFSLAWRYPDEHEQSLVDVLAKLHGIAHEQILPGNGSGEILKVAAAAFTAAGKKLVLANPTFEAILAHARTAQAEVVNVDLTPHYAHDLPRMLAAAKDAGLVYICNPNNPTASITPKDQIRAFLAKVPGQTIVLIDEAYHHYVESNDYESVIPLVKQYPNLIVARTFSKVYGMAGLRCGYCVARPELIRRMRDQQTWDSLNIMALVAAVASLQDTEQVEQGRRRNSEVKKYVYSELDRAGFKFIPSHANFLMVDLRREVRPIIAAMHDRNVQVGRVFTALPNFMRVTIGTRPQMETFVSAFREVMA
ncbi:MAG TPA: histidinol-phosphate transaminase [Blastocatellia bacterium]|nr:histidinol-phosphate transaminase [Blastocatellia bacterium]